MTIIKEALSHLMVVLKNPKDPDYDKYHDLLKLQDKLDVGVTKYVEVIKKESTGEDNE